MSIPEREPERIAWFFSTAYVANANFGRSKWLFFKQILRCWHWTYSGMEEALQFSGRELIPENVAIVRDFLQAFPKPTTLLGHSLGGMIVHDLVGAPGVERIVFVDSPCLALEEKVKYYQSYHDKILAEQDPAAFFQDWFTNFVTEKATAAERESIIQEAVHREPHWMADVMAGVAQPQPRTTESGAVFIIEGAQYFGGDTKTSWRQLYPLAKHWLYPGRGHFYFLEDPMPFNQALRAFLEAAD